MDNLAHTLVGAALGRAVADHKVPRAALLGAVAANAPDWTELFIGLPAETADYLTLHRGITHSFLGVAIQIVALWAAVAIPAAFLARRRGHPAPPWRWIGLCIAVTVLSHPYLDWQGSYGLRPWLPWNGRWYYGDFVAIVDVFFWIVPLVALAWGAARHWAPAALVALAGLPMAALVLVILAHLVAAWVKLAFLALALAGAVGWTRHWFGVAVRRRAAAWGLGALAAYALAQGGMSVVARVAVRRDARARFGPAAGWAALTVAGHPFSWRGMYGSSDSVAGPDWSLPRRLGHPAVQRALRDTPEGRAMEGFARFLVAEAEADSEDGGTTVYLRDARFTLTAREGWGVIVIRSEEGRRTR